MYAEKRKKMIAKGKLIFANDLETLSQRTKDWFEDIKKSRVNKKIEWAESYTIPIFKDHKNDIMIAVVVYIEKDIEEKPEKKILNELINDIEMRRSTIEHLDRQFIVDDIIDIIRNYEREYDDN